MDNETEDQLAEALEGIDESLRELCVGQKRILEGQAEARPALQAIVSDAEEAELEATYQARKAKETPPEKPSRWDKRTIQIVAAAVAALATLATAWVAKADEVAPVAQGEFGSIVLVDDEVGQA